MIDFARTTVNIRAENGWKSEKNPIRLFVVTFFCRNEQNSSRLFFGFFSTLETNAFHGLTVSNILYASQVPPADTT